MIFKICDLAAKMTYYRSLYDYFCTDMYVYKNCINRYRYSRSLGIHH